jgi:hypothetical protein
MPRIHEISMDSLLKLIMSFLMYTPKSDEDTDNREIIESSTHTHTRARAFLFRYSLGSFYITSDFFLFYCSCEIPNSPGREKNAENVERRCRSNLIHADIPHCLPLLLLSLGYRGTQANLKTRPYQCVRSQLSSKVRDPKLSI